MPPPFHSGPERGTSILPDVEQSLGERAWVEILEIVKSFPHPDKLNRHPQFVGNRDHYPPMGAAVELGQRDSGYSNGFVKLPGLNQRVLTRRGVQHKKHVMWKRGRQFAEHSFDFAQLLHQVGFRVEPPGSVNQHQVR